MHFHSCKANCLLAALMADVYCGRFALRPLHTLNLCTFRADCVFSNFAFVAMQSIRDEIAVFATTLSSSLVLLRLVFSLFDSFLLSATDVFLLNPATDDHGTNIQSQPSAPARIKNISNFHLNSWRTKPQQQNCIQVSHLFAYVLTHHSAAHAHKHT